MFRRAQCCRQIISLALPCALLWSWMACVCGCAEISENKKRPSASAAVSHNSETAFVGEPDCADSCPVTAAPAIFYERQAISAPALKINNPAFSPSSDWASVASAREPEINRHLPPPLGSRLFLRLQNFRI